MYSNGRLLKRFAVLMETERDFVHTGTIIGRDKDNHFVLFLSRNRQRMKKSIFIPNAAPIKWDETHLHEIQRITSEGQSFSLFVTLAPFPLESGLFHGLHTHWREIAPVVGQFFYTMGCVNNRYDEEQGLIPFVADLQYESDASMSIKKLEADDMDTQKVWGQKSTAMVGALVFDGEGDAVGIITQAHSERQRLKVFFFSKELVNTLQHIFCPFGELETKVETLSLDNEILKHHHDLFDMLSCHHMTLSLAQEKWPNLLGLPYAFLYQRARLTEKIQTVFSETYEVHYQCFMTAIRQGNNLLNHFNCNKVPNTKILVVFLHLVFIKHKYKVLLRLPEFEKANEILERLLTSLEKQLHAVTKQDRQVLTRQKIETLFGATDMNESNFMIQKLLSHFHPMIIFFVIHLIADGQQLEPSQFMQFVMEKAGDYTELTLWIQQKSKYIHFPQLNEREKVAFYKDSKEEWTQLNLVLDKIKDKKKQNQEQLFITCSYYEILFLLNSRHKLEFPINF